MQDAIPMLSGSMYDEGQLFVYELFTKPLGRTEYDVIIEGVFGIKASKRILNMYPFDLMNGETDGRRTLNTLATDLIFYCPLRNVTRGYQNVIGTTEIPTYIYRFKHKMSFDCWGANYTFCLQEVCHGSELPFVFNVFTDGVSVSYTPTPEEITLARDMGSAWTNFMYSGNPNIGPLMSEIPVQYPLYRSSEDMNLIIEEPGSFVQSRARDSYCDMWDSLGYFY